MHTTYDRWIWIELIGFDNEREDYGVSAFLENAGFVPEVASLLLFNADFIHQHDGLAQERPLPDDVCSYAGHPFNGERHRQRWTNWQLRGLVRELQRHGVAVYPAVFDLFVTREWIGQHPELFFTLRTGETWGSLCPLKRLADGRLYEEFFVAQLVRVMRDYGFDGYHGADGYAHPRLPIYEADFSDDLVEQFRAATGATLPPALASPCDGDPERIARRADWLWSERRREWIAFHRQRFAGFWRKVVTALHAEGKPVVLNSAWTRDPFEALYRYGVDYRALVAAGVDGFVTEAAAAASETEREAAAAGVLYEFQAMLLLNRAYTPTAKMRYLHGVKDTREQWNVLRHAPTSLEREVHALSSLYRWTGDGRLERCADGLVVCLADAIRHEEWQWLREVWDRAFSGTPTRPVGATLVWSDAALEAQVEDYIETRRWSTHRLLHRLMARGAPIPATVRIEELDRVGGPILVLNPHLLPAAERARVLAYAGGPVLLIGPEEERLPTPAAAHFAAGEGLSRLACWVYGVEEPPAIPLAPETLPAREEAVLHQREPRSFLEDLPFHDVSERFLEACAELIARCSGSPRVLHGADRVRLLAMEEAPGRRRLLVGNDSHGYVTAHLDMGQPVASVTVLGPFPPLPIAPEGSCFSVRVPGRGAVLLAVTLATPDADPPGL